LGIAARRKANDGTDHMPERTVGQRIRDARIDLERRTGRKVTQRDLARMVGVSKSTITHWETDVQQPKAENLIRLARALGVTPAYILGIEEQ
jgi:transcriptional regulator with XRE-family HTH domain